MRNDPIVIDGMSLEPYEAGTDWFIPRDTNIGDKRIKKIPVKFCPKCEKCYQKNWGTNHVTNYYIDFPVFSVDIQEECEFCLNPPTKPNLKSSLSKVQIIKAYLPLKKTRAIDKRLKQLQEKYVR